MKGSYTGLAVAGGVAVRGVPLLHPLGAFAHTKEPPRATQSHTEHLVWHNSKPHHGTNTPPHPTHTHTQVE